MEVDWLKPVIKITTINFKNIKCNYNSSWDCKRSTTKSWRSSSVRDPLYSSIFCPFLYNRSVGNPSTSWSSHNCLLVDRVQSTLTIWTLGLSMNFLPKSSQVGAKRLQCPHQGAKNLIKVTPFSIPCSKVSPVRFNTDWMLSFTASSLSSTLSVLFCSILATYSFSSSWVRAPEYLSIFLPFSIHSNVGYPLISNCSQTERYCVQSTLAIFTNVSWLLLLASSSHVGASFWQWPHHGA